MRIQRRTVQFELDRLLIGSAVLVSILEFLVQRRDLIGRSVSRALRLRGRTLRLRGFLIRVLNIGLYRIELFRRPRVQFGNLSVNTGNPAIDLVDVVSNFFDLTLSGLDLRSQSVG